MGTKFNLKVFRVFSKNKNCATARGEITSVVENKGRFPKVRTGRSEGHFEDNRSSRSKVISHETRIMSPYKLRYVARKRNKLNKERVCYTPRAEEM